MAKIGMDVVGACGRGGSFRTACEACGDVIIRAVCDIKTEGLPKAAGIHEAMDMTLPGLVSQESILQGGKWLPVPDSRKW
ncbi:MAG: hypothetical protein C0404_07120 [Verrucomicrobia bacterium]|nr:hypothetical protein [Verrucomicrobiota bacterium]